MRLLPNIAILYLRARCHCGAVFLATVLLSLICACDSTLSFQNCEKGALEEQQLCLQNIIEKSPKSTLQFEKIQRACSEIQGVVLREECFFLLSDEFQLLNEEAIQQCALAGAFQEDCLRHAAARHVEVELFPQLWFPF